MRRVPATWKRSARSRPRNVVPVVSQTPSSRWTRVHVAGSHRGRADGTWHGVWKLGHLARAARQNGGTSRSRPGLGATQIKLTVVVRAPVTTGWGAGDISGESWSVARTRSAVVSRVP